MIIMIGLEENFSSLNDQIMFVFLINNLLSVLAKVACDLRCLIYKIKWPFMSDVKIITKENYFPSLDSDEM